MRRLLLVGFVLVMAGCDGLGITVDIAGSPDLVVPDGFGSSTDVTISVDAEVEDAPTELWTYDGAAPMEVRELAPECEPGTGCFLDPCDSGAECLSGLCVDHMGDSVCTTTCIEECPQGWLCEQAGSGPDGLFACVSPYTHLCRPCAGAADCQSATGVEDVCVSFGSQGSFCGAECGPDEVCPAGYSCSEVETVAGVALKQCTPDSGICTCSAKSVKLGLSTPCYVENESGTCDGIRVCTEEGLSACDAVEAAPETCDGLDNDCDGSTDNVDCSDGNDCTDDECDPGVGCVHSALTGTTCDDGDVCTLADHCQEGICVGTGIDCSDKNSCTTDACDPTGGCIYTFNASSCDDSNACTVNDTCSQGECVGFELPCQCDKDSDCVEFEDGDVCSGTLICDMDQIPYQCVLDVGSIVTCPVAMGPGAECVAASCHPLSGECSQVPANEGQACTDQNLCTMNETCSGGGCGAGSAVNCNDGNLCTDDSCLPETGCVQVPNTAPCNDGDACTAEDLCSGGLCVGGQALQCDDGNPCTADLCDPQQGCVYSHAPGDCDDGNLCTLGDACVGGTCAGGELLQCGDDNPCTDDGCDPALGCTHMVNEQPCNDGDICTIADVCGNGVCAGLTLLDCNDGNPCTSDKCASDVGCLHEMAVGPCDDLNECTVDDQCVNGKCQGTGSPECDDANPCTKDFCLAQGGCSHEMVAAACEDGDPCTTGDQCVNGQCVPGDLLDCDDANPCTADLCSGGQCLHDPVDGECDDSNACTVGDACVGGKCQGGDAPDCDDSDVCSTDYCSPALGCVHSLNDAPCDDDDLCTTGDHCHLGECIHAGSLLCEDGNVCTDDACSPAAGCTHTANQAVCDDGNECTTTDQCSTGQCKGTGYLDCDDQSYCTNDWCDPTVGCVHQANQAPCDDGDLCTVGDLCAAGQCEPGNLLNCDDGNLCTDDDCAPDSGCTHADNAEACDDEDECTTDDHCMAGECIGGEPPDCQDDDHCTADSCDSAIGCVNADIVPCCGNGQLEGAEQCDDGNLSGGDGCNANCMEEGGDCQPPGVQQSLSPGADMMVCEDPAHNTCEQNFENLCPTGWHLCSRMEFNNRNSGWSFNPGKQSLGVIQCRNGGGAGHYTVNGNLASDTGDNCSDGSSRPSCPSGYGCNEKTTVALCCAPHPLCGNGDVDSVEESCDDGNQSEEDSCLNNCWPRSPPWCN